VMLLTPLLGEAATTSWPPWRRRLVAEGTGLRAVQGEGPLNRVARHRVPVVSQFEL
jgi:hypothetical protein